MYSAARSNHLVENKFLCNLITVVSIFSQKLICIVYKKKKKKKKKKNHFLKENRFTRKNNIENELPGFIIHFYLIFSNIPFTFFF